MSSQPGRGGGALCVKPSVNQLHLHHALNIEYIVLNIEYMEIQNIKY